MEKIKIDDFSRYKFLSGIKHSPDGKHAAFTVYEPDFEGNKYNSCLWAMNTETGSCFQLTSFGSEKGFLWLDNDNLAFPGERDPKDKEKLEAGEEFTQLYKINIHGGEALPYLRLPIAAVNITILNDNSLMFLSEYNAGMPLYYTLSQEEREERLKYKKAEKDYEVLDEIPFWANNVGFVNKIRTGLFLYNIKEKKLTPITSGFTSVENYKLNKSKTKAVVILSEYTDKMPVVNKLAIYDIENNSLEILCGKAVDGKIFPENLSFSSAEFIDDDSIIYTASDCKRYGINENHKWYTMKLSTGETTCLIKDYETSLWVSVGSDCRLGASQTRQLYNGKVYFLTTECHNTYLNTIDSNAKVERIIGSEGAVDGFSVSDNSLLFIGLKGNRLQEVYKLSGGKEIQLTHFNDWVNEERSVVTPEYLKVETAPGVTIEGWIMKPSDFKEGIKYPAILDIHGGPKTVYGSVFIHEMQYWANHGYAVFFCNPRGSDGRGNEFSDIRGKYGTIDYDDLIAFTDEIISRYSFIDKDRIGVTGGSYGGFMTNWIIGHTDRFRAAASQRSISNWISKFCTTDIGYYFAEDQNGATPWNNYEKLWEHSPLKYADKVKTPTLFIHSQEDYRCWLAEGLQMFTALKYHGVEARLCMFKGENHELSRSGKPQHRLRRLKEITDWFDGHLK
jgi:dipeptidyl aminopeptidase/acylaminoacyl peptidase